MNIIKLINRKPSFLITIDTEGDNLWSKPDKINTENAKYLPRFQQLCEKYNFKPTYLVDYEMANSPIFQDFGIDVIKRKSGEMGMHLHAWNTPPLLKLTTDDYKYQPYLIEYPQNVMKLKIEYLTKMLRRIFSIKIHSHRAGRWALNETYAKILIENGYRVDCSVTPFIFWQNKRDYLLRKNINYYNSPTNSYFLNLNDIRKKGNSSLLEIPVTVMELNKIKNFLKSKFSFFPWISSFFDYIHPTTIWFRPKINNFHMIKIIKHILNDKSDYIEFILHSSELMPGGSPIFRFNQDIEILYRNLESIFKIASKYFIGRTLKEFYDIKIRDVSCK